MRLPVGGVARRLGYEPHDPMRTVTDGNDLEGQSPFQLGEVFSGYAMTSKADEPSELSDDCTMRTI
jgi:hypothetical protein